MGVERRTRGIKDTRTQKETQAQKQKRKQERSVHPFSRFHSFLFSCHALSPLNHPFHFCSSTHPIHSSNPNPQALMTCNRCSSRDIRFHYLVTQNFPIHSPLCSSYTKIPSAPLFFCCRVAVAGDIHRSARHQKLWNWSLFGLRVLFAASSFSFGFLFRHAKLCTLYMCIYAAALSLFGV